MAKIKLDRETFEKGQLPAKCICCGLSSTQTKRRKFYHSPTWMLVFNYLPLGRRVFSFSSVMSTVPICRRHMSRFSLSLRIVLSWFGLVVLGFLITVLLAVASNTLAVFGIISTMALIAIAVFCVTPLTFYLDVCTPRLVEFDGSTVTLDSVADGFVDAIVSKPSRPNSVAAEKLTPGSARTLALVLGIIAALVTIPAVGFVFVVGLAVWAAIPAVDEARQVTQRELDRHREMRHDERPPKKRDEPLTLPHFEQPKRDLADAGKEQDATTPPDQEQVATVVPEKVVPEKKDPDRVPESVADAIILFKTARDLERKLTLLNWLEEQDVAEEDRDAVVEMLSTAFRDHQMRVPAMKLACRHGSEKHADLFLTAAKNQDVRGNGGEYKQLSCAKLREMSDTRILEHLFRDLRTDAETIALAELKAWGKEAVPLTLTHLNDGDERVRRGAEALVTHNALSNHDIVAQCLVDIEAQDRQSERAIRRLVLCEVDPDLQVRVGEVMYQQIDARRFQKEAREVFLKHVTTDHVDEIIKLLERDDNGCRDSGRESAIKLKDPKTYPALVRLIDVPFGDRPTAEVCRKIGPSVQSALLPYLLHENDGKVTLVCEILRDIGTRTSLQPLLRMGQHKSRRVREKAAEAIITIQRQGAAREKLAREEQRAREAANAPEPIVRTWKDASGKFETEAELVEKSDKVVTLRVGEKVVKVPIAKLCEEDQKFLASLKQ